jgi:uncharacterized protein (DUF305 family)
MRAMTQAHGRYSGGCSEHRRWIMRRFSILLSAVMLVSSAVALSRPTAVAQQGTPPAAGLADDPCAAVGQGSLPAMMTPGPMWPDMMTPGAMGPGMMMGDPELMTLDMLRYHVMVDTAIARVAVARAEQPEVRRLAEEVLRARQAEADQLNQWRQQWYPGQPELPVGPMMGMMMGPMMESMMQGTPWPGMPAMPTMAEMLPIMGMMGMGPQSFVTELCSVSPVDSAVVDAMTVSTQMTQAMPRMMQQWVTRPELRQFAQDAAATRQQELEELLELQQTLPAAETDTGTPTSR